MRVGEPPPVSPESAVHLHSRPKEHAGDGVEKRYQRGRREFHLRGDSAVSSGRQHDRGAVSSPVQLLPDDAHLCGDLCTASRGTRGLHLRKLDMVRWGEAHSTNSYRSSGDHPRFLLWCLLSHANNNYRVFLFVFCTERKWNKWTVACVVWNEMRYVWGTKTKSISSNVHYTLKLSWHICVSI